MWTRWCGSKKAWHAYLHPFFPLRGRYTVRLLWLAIIITAVWAAYTAWWWR
jgi:hypothetical protein